MQVKDLSKLEDKTQFVPTLVNQMEYRNDTLAIDSQILQLDNEDLELLGSFLGMPKRYLPKLPEELRRTLVEHHKGQWTENNEAVAVVREGHLLGFGPPNRPAFHVEDFVKVIQNVLPKNAEVSQLVFGRQHFLTKIRTSQLSVEAKPGDITQGGIKIDAYTGPAEYGPSISSYLERLVCSNGMTMSEVVGSIPIRGHTVPEVLESMEEAANLLLVQNDEGLVQHRLHQWASLAQVEVNDPAVSIVQLGRQNDLSARLVTRMIEDMPDMIEGNTLYDVINHMTSYTNREGISLRQVDALQSMAGNVISAADVGHHCAVCHSTLN